MTIMSPLYAYLLFCLELSAWLDDYAIPAPGDD